MVCALTMNLSDRRGKPERMKSKTKSRKLKARAGSLIWQVREGRKNIAGGFCKTKKDAENDGRVWMRLNDGTQRPGSPDGSLATETRKPGSLK